jgi:N-acetylglutamate synthase-like GNAT family acetyltransferase
MKCTDSTSSQIKLRAANIRDLVATNRVIERAVKTWKLPERVIRLVMPAYLYTEHDLQHLHIELAEDSIAGIIGVAAWEEAAARDCPHGKRALLLHGLYVDPAQQHSGIGTRLLSVAASAARENGYDGLLVKAQTDAEDFFRARGLQRLAVADEARDYPNRFWLNTHHTEIHG